MYTVRIVAFSSRRGISILWNPGLRHALLELLSLTCSSSLLRPQAQHNFLRELESVTVSRQEDTTNMLTINFLPSHHFPFRADGLQDNVEVDGVEGKLGGRISISISSSSNISDWYSYQDSIAREINK